MSWLKDFKLWRLMPLAAFFFSLPAFAQFEVAPDHFDSSESTETIHKRAAKNKTALARPGTSSGVSRTTARPVTKADPKGSRATDARPAGGRLNVKTNGLRTSQVDRSRSVRGKRRAGSNVATATSTPSMPQRE
jgi:hypothetical protein